MDNNELGQITGEDRAFVVIGETKIWVDEVTMGNLQQFTRACSPFLREFDEPGKLNPGEGKPMEEFALFKVLSENAPAFCLAASLVTPMPAQFYERMKPDDFFKVAHKIIEVNGNFFVQRLAPQLVKFAQAMAQVGSILSRT